MYGKKKSNQLVFKEMCFLAGADIKMVAHHKFPFTFEFLSSEKSFTLVADSAESRTKVCKS